MYSLSRRRNPTYLCRPENYPYFMGSGIGPRTKTCINLGEPIVMVPYLHQGIVYIKLRVWRAQKCSRLLGAETALTCAGWQTTSSHGWRYKAENGKLHKFGWTYRHGTMFAPRHCLYHNEATGIERTEMHSLNR